MSLSGAAAVPWCEKIKSGVVAAMLLTSGLCGSIAAAQCSPLAYWLSDTGGYWDGGTIYFVVTDSVGCTIEGCFDGRGMVERPGALWLGAKHPTFGGARVATADEEARVIEILLRAIHAKWPDIELRGHLAIPYELAKLPKLGEGSWSLIREIVCRRSDDYWQAQKEFRR